MDYFTYTIKEEPITKQKYIGWGDVYHIVNRTGSKEIIVDLDFNVKDGKPCLHFRYNGFKLCVKDKVYFLDTLKNPIIECEVNKQPHIYKEKLKEVDFNLLEEDIKSLKKQASHFQSIYIKHYNGDAPTEIKNVERTLFYDNNFTELRKLIGLPIRDNKPNNVNMYKQYILSYIQALRQIGVSDKGTNLDKSPSICEQVVSSSIQDQCYVYLMHDKRNGYHKIGISKEPKYREKTLQSEQPAIEMVCSKRYPVRKIAEAIEAALHKAYAEQRVRGEWFNLSEIDVQMLKETLS